MTGGLLDSSMALRHSHDDGGHAIYTIELEFTDLFGRRRKHADTVSLPLTQSPRQQVSFTAMSSVNMGVAVVESVSDLNTGVMFSDGNRVTLANYHDFTPSVGDVVSVLEHFYVNSTERMFYVILPHPLNIDPEMLALQSINADILDESGKLVYRLSADPLFKGGSHGASVGS